ncbi:MAG: alkaline phosphatase family protein [Chthoniobacterales bacterium]|nr:alkaline phosphatase family protein [Chthoniobacterales bacterium]
MKSPITLVAIAVTALASSLALASADDLDNRNPAIAGHEPRVQHVLLLSVDGMHALDFANLVKTNPASALGQLSRQGVTYTHAFAMRPSDSFPGLLAIVTGGSPISTGVWYDNSYDRALLPPITFGGGSTPGTNVLYDESIDLNPDARDGGGGINPDALPRDPTTGNPVYPHQFLKTNTIFEVAHRAHLRTAWSDKHLAYEIVQGPSGQGVDDLFNPEVAAPNPAYPTVSTTSSVQATEDYDDTKVAAILNEIAGYDHTGTTRVGVPALFGMNFQAVSVGQKLKMNVLRDGSIPPPDMVTGGYIDGQGVPQPALAEAIAHTDASIEQMVAALRDHGLLESTLIIVTSKHGQSPIDPRKLVIAGESTIPDIVGPSLIAQATQDDIALLWLTDQSQTDAAVALLEANLAVAHIDTIFAGLSLRLQFPNPLNDSRTPDIIVRPVPGVIYTDSSTKIAEHGGFDFDDTNVVLVLSNPSLNPRTIKTPVQTMQIAPTILASLGLDPQSLKAVRKEAVKRLPGLGEE